MMRDERPEFYVQGERRRRWWQQLGFGLRMAVPMLAAIFVGTKLWPAHDDLVALLGFGLGWLWCFGGRRLGLRVDRKGLFEWFWCRLPRRTPWEQVTSVEAGDESAVIRTARGEIEVDGNLDNWLRLVTRVQRHLGREPAEQRGDPVPPEQVAAWLGVRPGQALRVHVPYWYGMLLFIGGYFAFLLGLTARTGGWSMAALPAVVFALVLAMFRQMDHMVFFQVRADADGLRVRSLKGWRSYPWSSLRQVERVWQFQRVVTTEGDLFFAPAGRRGRQLLEALRKACEARNEGLVLPRMGAVPEGAISRAGETGSVQAERGLSRR